jgi:uncharacterized protein YpbB
MNIPNVRTVIGTLYGPIVLTERTEQWLKKRYPEFDRMSIAEQLDNKDLENLITTVRVVAEIAYESGIELKEF